MLNIQKYQIAYNISRRTQPIQFIVIHDTGNRGVGADATMHYKYFNGGDRQSSADFFVDDHSILQVNDYTRNFTWHCGDGKGAYGITNSASIGIEMCINSDGNYEATVKNTIDLTKYLMRELNIPVERVVRHYDASRKNCPQTMNYNNWEGWKKFKAALNTLEFTITDKTGVATILVDGLNIRKLPGGDVINNVANGAKYKITGITNNGWYRLAYNGGAAFITADPKYVQYSSDVGGMITMQDLNELKKELKIPDSSWAVPEVKEAMANGIIKQMHDPNELVTFGVMITIFNNMYEQLKRKGSV